jgi:hypothetical protein
LSIRLAQVLDKLGLRESAKSEALAKLGGCLAVAKQAEGTEIVEVALTAALGYGTDVVGVPEGAAGGDGAHAVETQAGDAGWAACSLQSVVGGDGVDAADGAEAVVAGEDLVSKIAGVGAETPLVDTVRRAEGAAAFGKDLQVAPAAEGKAVGTGKKGVGNGAAAGKSACGMHACFKHRASGDDAGLVSRVPPWNA